MLDVGGFWQPLLVLFDAMVERSILKPKNHAILLDDPDPARLLDRLAEQELGYEPKWIGEDIT